MKSGTLILFLIFSACLLMGQSIREMEGADLDIEHRLSNLTWSHINFTTNATSYERLTTTLMNSVGAVLMECARFLVIEGFNNPEYDFNFFFNVIRFYVYAQISLILLVLAYILIMTGYDIYKKWKEEKGK